jgi:hypothetical protein
MHVEPMFLSAMTIVDVQIYMATRSGELLRMSCLLDGRRKPPLIISFEPIFLEGSISFLYFIIIIILL